MMVSVEHYVVSNNGNLVNNELEKDLERSCRGLSRHLPGGIEKNLKS
jgi:hypothetical protein